MMEFRIDREAFGRALEKIQQLHEKEETLCQVLSGYDGGLSGEVIESNLALLAVVTEDHHGYIDWWVFETGFGQWQPNVYEGDTGTYLDTAGKLYDFLLEEARRRASPDDGRQ